MNKDGDYPIHVAVNNKNYSGIVALLQYQKGVLKEVLLKQKNATGQTALELASELLKKNQENTKLVSIIVKTLETASGKQRATFASSGQAQAIMAPTVSASASSSSSSAQPTLSVAAAATPQATSIIDINQKDQYGNTKLHYAARDGRIDEVKDLLARGAHINSKGQGGWTALHCAAYKNQAAIAEHLLAGNLTGKADINATTNDGLTPLMIAAENGALGVVNWLLCAKANIQIKDKIGWTALHCAAYKNQAAIAEHLLAGNLTGKADINATTNDGLTPLMIAAGHGALGVVNWLLCAKANIQIKDKIGWTALHHAAAKNQVAIAEILLKGNPTGKADINATINDGLTPLMIAVASGAVGVVNWLLDAKANIQAKDKNGLTALHRAAYKNQVAIAQRLLAGNSTGKADINATTNYGQTSLMIAAANGAVDVVNWLLDAKANIHAKDKKGLTAYDWANMGLNKFVKPTDTPAQAQKRRNDYQQILFKLQPPVSSSSSSAQAAQQAQQQVSRIQNLPETLRQTLLTPAGTLQASQDAQQAAMASSQQLSLHEGSQPQSSSSASSSSSSSSGQLAIASAPKTPTVVPMTLSPEQPQLLMQQMVPTPMILSETVQEQPHAQQSVNALWPSIVEEILHECTRILANYKITGSETVRATVKSQLIGLYSSLQLFYNRESFINGIMGTLKKNLISLISESDSNDFGVDLESALRGLIRREDIVSKLQALALLGFSLKASADFVELKRNYDDHDDDNTPGSMALSKKSEEKTQQTLSKDLQLEPSSFSWSNLKGLGMAAALLSLRTVLSESKRSTLFGASAAAA